MVGPDQVLKDFYIRGIKPVYAQISFRRISCWKGIERHTGQVAPDGFQKDFLLEAYQKAYGESWPK